MFAVIQSVIDRVKALFTLDIALDLEHQFVARQAERKAVLLRQANEFEKEGLASVAADLRHKAEEQTERSPLQIVLPYFGHELTSNDHKTPKLAAVSNGNGNSGNTGNSGNSRLRLPQPQHLHEHRKKGK